MITSLSTSPLRVMALKCRLGLDGFVPEPVRLEVSRPRALATHFAHPASRVVGGAVGVVGGELMASFAMRLRRVYGRMTNTAQQIFSRCYRLQMVGVNASPNAAKMVKKHSGRYRASVHLVRKSVRFGLLLVSNRPPIAADVNSAHPNPAPCLIHCIPFVKVGPVVSAKVHTSSIQDSPYAVIH